MAIARLKDSGELAGAVRGFDATALVSTSRIVTPMRTFSNRLKLIAWSYANNGSVSRLNDSGNAGPFISNVACPAVSPPGNIVTAVREGDSLALMEWKCGGAGAEIGVVTSGVTVAPATAVAASLGVGQTYVTALRGPHGGLRLASWKKGGAKLGNGKAGEIATLGRPQLADTLLVPVILACSERLRLIAWTMTSAGRFTRTGDSKNQAGAVSRISCAHIGGKWATAVRDGNGRLKVIFWEMKAGGPERIGDSGSNGLEIIDVDVAGLWFNEVDFQGVEPEWRVVTAVRTRANRLRLLTWTWKQATGKVTLVDDSTDQEEEISLLRLLHLANDRFVTVVRDNATSEPKKPGHLKLITWSIS